MPTAEKEAAIAEFRERLANSEIAIVSKYTGITVLQDTQLRKALRDAGVTYKVYKNNLARIALQEANLEAAAELMDGPSAWSFSSDPVAPAKLFKQFSEKFPVVAVQGGILTGKVIKKEQIKVLADLPSQDELRAQVVGVIAMPLRNLVGALNALPRNLVNAVDQIRKQKEEGGAEAA